MNFPATNHQNIVPIIRMRFEIIIGSRIVPKLPWVSKPLRESEGIWESWIPTNLSIPPFFLVLFHPSPPPPPPMMQAKLQIFRGEKYWKGRWLRGFWNHNLLGQTRSKRFLLPREKVSPLLWRSWEKVFHRPREETGYKPGKPQVSC